MAQNILITPKINRRALILTGGFAMLAIGCKPQPSVQVQVPVSAIPETLKVPATDTLAFKAHAEGVQIYEGRPKKEDATQYEWALKAPEADLFDERGSKIGRHYGGPTWESTDGSKVVGELKSREPSTEASAIPWLLLSVKAHEGSGVFSAVDYVQRLETVGGKAPAMCDPSSAGKELRVPYSAVYYFYAAKP